MLTSLRLIDPFSAWIPTGNLLTRMRRHAGHRGELATTVTDHGTKHLHWLADGIGHQLLDAIIIHTGPHAYRRPVGIGVVSLGLLG